MVSPVTESTTAGASPRGGAGASAVNTRGVRLDEVGMTYVSEQGATDAIGSVTGTVVDGRFVSVIGPSGCGKTTLLDIVGGLMRPTRGRVSIDGDVVTGPRRDMAMVFQEDSTLHWRTVLQNVAFGLEVAGVPKRERLERCRAMIDLVGLSGFERHHPRQPSGGMKQRVALARALVLEPRILLMDEPFGALDAQTRQLRQGDLIGIWQRSPKTVIFVTHDVQEAVYLASRVAVMTARPGQIKTIVDIAIDKSDRHVAKSKAFVDAVDEIWGLVRDEAIKAQKARASP